MCEFVNAQTVYLYTIKQFGTKQFCLN